MNSQTDQIKTGGLLPLPSDGRDFSLDKVFGSLEKYELPNEDFVVAQPIKIKDQRDSDFCAAFASTEVSEDQEGVELSPEWFFAQVKKLMGDYKAWGSDLRTAMRAAVEVGFIEAKDAPFNLDTHDRDFLANWKNWPLELNEKAKEHAKQSFFAVDGPHDAFDNFRGALWKNRTFCRSIVTGATWQRSWTPSINGVIPSEFMDPEMGHAFKIYGQKTIDKKMYLVAQLSNGSGIGDGGIYYFPREVINRDFKFGAYMFIDIDPKEAKKVAWPLWMRIWEFIKNIFK